MTENCLELNNVCKSFKGFTLNNISFSLPKGHIMGLVGANGAGKTTTIQLILNLIEKDNGEIYIFGKDHIVYERAVKQDIGIVFDSMFFAGSWTVRDTKKAISPFYDSWRDDIFEEMLRRFNLPQGIRICEMPSGMQTKLMLACALSHNAKLLIFDEPASGSDPIVRSELLDILQNYIKDGERSVLFSTHITSGLEKIANSITLINRGNMVFTGSTADLRDSYRVIRGNPNYLTQELEMNISGFRITNMGFEGLIHVNEAEKYGDFTLENATIDDIVVCISRGGWDKWQLF